MLTGLSRTYSVRTYRRFEDVTEQDEGSKDSPKAQTPNSSHVIAIESRPQQAIPKRRAKKSPSLVVKLLSGAALLLSSQKSRLSAAYTTTFRHIPKFYDNPVEVLGRRVFKHITAVVSGRPKLIDKGVSPSIKQRLQKGETNLSLMRSGNAPIGPDGKQVELHHILQEEPGPMAEIVSTTHTRYHKALHGIKEESFRRKSELKKQYTKFRKDYWKTRAEDFKK